MDWIKLGDQDFLHITTGTRVQLALSDTNPTLVITYRDQGDGMVEQRFRAAWFGDLEALNKHIEDDSIRAERLPS